MCQHEMFTVSVACCISLLPGQCTLGLRRAHCGGVFAGKLLVNFDRGLAQTMAEAKALARMQVPLPEAARVVLLQEEKFQVYYDTLTHALQVLPSLNPRPSVRAHGQAMNPLPATGLEHAVSLLWLPAPRRCKPHYPWIGILLQACKQLLMNAPAAPHSGRWCCNGARRLRLTRQSAN